MKYRKEYSIQESDDGVEVTGGADLPQAFADEPSHPKAGIRRARAEQRSRANSINTSWMLPFGVLMVLVLIASYVLVSKHEDNLVKHLQRDEKIHQQEISREFDVRFSELQAENDKLRQQLHHHQDLQNQLDESRENDLKKQIEQLTAYKKKMQQNIQLMSKTALLEKFGPGPHRVEIKVQFDPSFPKESENEEDTGTIIIELAPVEELPHVVYWFLEQVNRKLYDLTSFHRNAGHVIQGGPAPNFLSPPNPQLHKRFKDSGFDSILFQEYSAKFPHVQYTLGFAGRPGGPDFYISTRDNSINHGPGGQSSYEDPSEADPCFAKVVEGFDVVNRMQRSPIKPGWYKAMQNNVAILSMRILQGR
ncbi:cyclophilin type peptidyl-prolyl cis-trans isomerase [Nitzschia inconspicua]|uniref:Cyclophilin type peptidyl-prolyl cis-trans isomerase n=1 Tax=Nitzschia inconspicua TaxID=303405 RepID=A0A9K3KXP7_9STRA|nr:cyclophilin type peptidyl-prolyl cis-trans isomerase [Nitzschia inconspicua]